MMTSSIDILEDLRHLLDRQRLLSGELVTLHVPDEGGAADVAIGVKLDRARCAGIADGLALLDESDSLLELFRTRANNGSVGILNLADGVANAGSGELRGDVHRQS